MKITAIILCALLCLSARAEDDAAPAKDSDEAIMAAAEKLVNEDKTKDAPQAAVEAAVATPTAAAPAPATAEIAKDMKDEASIPVFSKSEKLIKSESSIVWRLVASLAFIAAVAGGLLLASRRWSRQKNKGGEKARIEMLHQFHMGPKKSLALVRVAGEAILIGCTDHSINMLKTVTLIDDELEGVLNKDFNGFLDDEFSIQDVRAALGSNL